MDFATGLTTLDTRLDDGDNFTFSVDEKTQALTQAWNDPYVVEETYDSSLTYDNTVQQYTLPTGMRDVISIAQDPNNDSFQSTIPAEGFNVIAGKIHIEPNYRTYLTNGDTFYIWGWKKLTTSDSATDALLQEYILKLAQYNVLSLLINKAVNRFLKNDVSVSELLNVASRLERDIDDYRKQHRAISRGV